MVSGRRGHGFCPCAVREWPGSWIPLPRGLGRGTWQGTSQAGRDPKERDPEGVSAPHWPRPGEEWKQDLNHSPGLTPPPALEQPQRQQPVGQHLGPGRGSLRKITQNYKYKTGGK